MRKPIIAGNWKMNKTLAEAKSFVADTKNNVPTSDAVDSIICAPFPFLHALVEDTKGTDLKIAAQNMHFEESGAFTGEVSAEMIKSVGAVATLLGHSERRTYYGDNNQTLSEKLKIALDSEIVPTFCIGEVLEEREKNIHFEVVKSQVEEVLFKLNETDFRKIKIAYEPVWAIGTGKVATPEQAQEMHRYIRTIIAEKYGSEVAEDTTILYGGSCNPSNADGLFSQPDIDGGLIGGASLKADDFIALLNSLIKT